MKVTVAQATRERIAAWMNLQQANRVIQGLLEARLDAEARLSWPEFEVLWRLQIAAEHPLRMNQIAAQLIGSPSGTTRIADRLEREGLIARETPKDNRRVVEVKLTARGRTTLARADRVFREALEETFASHLSEAELASLRHIMRKLLESNGAWADARCEPPPPTG
jgi:DNA-binding MarR family transcriptional regulator